MADAHFIEVCPTCGAVVSQCRCPSPNKARRVSTRPCAACSGQGVQPQPAPPPGEGAEQPPHCVCLEHYGQHHPECPVLQAFARLRAELEEARAMRDHAMNRHAQAVSDRHAAEAKLAEQAARIGGAENRAREAEAALADARRDAERLRAALAKVPHLHFSVSLPHAIVTKQPFEHTGELRDECARLGGACAALAQLAKETGR